jgi:hypothetical protein
MRFLMRWSSCNPKAVIKAPLPQNIEFATSKSLAMQGAKKKTSDEKRRNPKMQWAKKKASDKKRQP